MALPATLNVLAILIASAAPVVSMVIYGVVPVLYFIAIVVDRSTAPAGDRGRTVQVSVPRRQRGSWHSSWPGVAPT